MFALNLKLHVAAVKGCRVRRFILEHTEQRNQRRHLINMAVYNVHFAAAAQRLSRLACTGKNKLSGHGSPHVIRSAKPLVRKSPQAYAAELDIQLEARVSSPQ